MKFWMVETDYTIQSDLIYTTTLYKTRDEALTAAGRATSGANVWSVNIYRMKGVDYSAKGVRVMKLNKDGLIAPNDWVETEWDNKIVFNEPRDIINER